MGKGICRTLYHPQGLPFRDFHFAPQADPTNTVHSEPAQAFTAEDGASHTHTPVLSPEAAHHHHAAAAAASLLAPAAHQQEQAEADDPASAHGSAEPMQADADEAGDVESMDILETAAAAGGEAPLQLQQQPHPRLRSEIRSGGISWQEFSQKQQPPPADLSAGAGIGRGRSLPSDGNGWGRAAQRADHDAPFQDSSDRSRAEESARSRDPARRSERELRENGRERGRDVRDLHDSRGGYERRGGEGQPQRFGEQHHSLDQARGSLYDRQPRLDRERVRERLSPSHRHRNSRSRSRSPKLGDGRAEEGGRRAAAGGPRSGEAVASHGLHNPRIQSDHRIPPSDARIQSDQAAAAAAAARRPGAGAAASLLRAAFKGVLETSPRDSTPADVEMNDGLAPVTGTRAGPAIPLVRSVLVRQREGAEQLDTRQPASEPASQAPHQRGSVFDRLKTGISVQQEPPSRMSVFQRMQGGCFMCAHCTGRG